MLTPRSITMTTRILACAVLLVVAQTASAQQPDAKDKPRDQDRPALPTLETTITVASGDDEADRAAVRQSVSDHLAHSLPLFGRNFLHLASLAAGYAGNPSYPSAQGQTFWANNVLVDGASHFSKWRSAARAFNAGYGLESIREVEILTNRFSAEYGHALASITAASTRAGTSRWHGSALIYWQDDGLSARPVFAARKPPSGLQQYGATVGGPLLRDRTYLFASYEGRRARAFNPILSPAAFGQLVRDDQDEHLAFIRIDERIAANHRLTARYNGQRFRWHNEPGGLVLPGSGTAWANDVHTVLVTSASTLSTRVLHELRVQFARFVERRIDLNPTTLISRAGYSLEGGSLGPLGFGADPEDTWEASDTWSHWAGAHALKFGAGIDHVRARNMLIAYGHGAQLFGGAPQLFPQPFLIGQAVASGPAAGVVNPRSVSGFGFIQDDWRLHPRLTVSAGLRYDLDRVYNVRGFTAPVDRDNVQPRFGVVWQLSGRTALRAGAGVYTQQHLLYPINRVALEGADGVQTVWRSPLAPSAGPRDIYRSGPRLENPYSHQWSAGGERRLPGQVVVAADYVYLRGRRLLSLIDENAPLSNAKPNVRSVAEADALRPIPPGISGYRKLITLGNDGDSWYHALQVKANRSSGRLQAMASYTLSDADDRANYELPEDSRTIAAERGRASTDVRHTLSAGMVWEIPGRGLAGGWSVSSVGTFRSNRPYTITWGDDRNGTTQYDARPGGRNTGRTGAYANVDLAATRRFEAGTASIEARIEAFNLLDTVNFDEYVGVLLSPFYAQPVSAYPPRRIQLAAIVRF